MNWIELSTQTDAEGAEAAATLLNEMIKGGAVIEQIITPDKDESFDPARAFTIRAFFSPDDAEILERAETALWHLRQLRAMSEPRRREIAEEDWAEAWKKHYTIQHIGKRIVIKPSWLDYSPRDSELVVELDPGMAFGSGLHPTTRLCLIALEEQMQTGLRVLDVGTGSGILAIAAAKMGARKVLALDIDSVAVETAARNAAINHVEKIVRVERDTIEAEHARDKFDLVCANILAEVICELAPTISANLARTGTVIACGILDFKADDVVAALRAVGIETIEQKQEDDWVALVGKKTD